MAEILRLPFLRHLRAEARSHVLYFRRGTLAASGAGVAFWFRPLSAAIAEVPVDDRDQSFLFHGRTLDFQTVTVQGAATYRIVNPEVIAQRIDFGIDLASGRWLREPLEQLATLVTQLIQQATFDYLAHHPLRTILQEGLQAVRKLAEATVVGGKELEDLGVRLVSIRISDVAPASEVDKALQAPAREAIQQEADQAVFQRRALAVEKERAIAENELQNQIELARREESLIERQGANQRRRATEEAEAERIKATADGERARLHANAQADGIRVVELARNEAEKERVATFRDLPGPVLIGLAARELAGKLRKIDHLNVTPDTLTALLQDLASAGTRKLKG